MRKLLLIAFFGICVTVVKSQQIYMESGQVISNLQFEDSQGNTLNNLQAVNNTFMKLGYRHDILTEKLFVNALASYNRYGAVGSDQDVDNYFAWDLTYLGINAGIDYEFFKPGDFTFYIQGEGSVEFLVRGTQQLNNQVYKLKGEEEFDSPIYMLRAGLGAQYKISEKLSVFTHYTYGGGAPFKSNEEKLRFKAHNFGFGLLINLLAKEPTSVDFDNAQTIQLRKDLEETGRRVNELEKEASRARELEHVIVVKDNEMKILKDAIARVLFDFSDLGLMANLRDNKIYVTLENDMLFPSGSWELETEGEKAINALANILAENPDLDILIEGHTDNQPYRGTKNIRNNWDLSTKRASAIVEILAKNKNIKNKNITAAGRGEFAPVASNATPEGRARNRRIEVIISPQLNEVLEIIK